MDPISAIFAAYLDVASSSDYMHMNDVSGSGEQTIYMEHKGIKIPYTFQQWKIKPASVCGAYNSDIKKYSGCAVAAKLLFASACNYLEYNPSTLANHIRNRDMYCNATINYEPAMVDVDWSNERSTRAEARSKCNLAIARLMSDAGLAARTSKEEECGKYDAIRANQVNN